MDEIINAAVVLLRMYCFQVYGQHKIVIADIDFFKFLSSNLSNEEKHDVVIRRYFKRSEMLNECTDMLIPILFHDHFILVVIEFQQRTIKLFDSLKGKQRPVTALIEEYSKDLLVYFNISDSAEFAQINMSSEITHQGNSYDCGCYTIWNMIRYIQGAPFVAIPIDMRQKIALWLLSQDHGIFFDKFKPVLDVITIIE